MVAENYTKIAKGSIEYELTNYSYGYTNIQTYPIKINMSLNFNPIEIYVLLNNGYAHTTSHSETVYVKNPLLSSKTNNSVTYWNLSLPYITNISNTGFTIKGSAIDQLGYINENNKKINIEWIAIG